MKRNLKIKTKVYKEVFVYIFSTLLFLVPVLVTSSSHVASIGFYLGCLCVLLYKKDIRYLIFYFSIIALNPYLMYVQMYPLSITVTSIIRMFPIAILVCELLIRPNLILDRKIIISFGFLCIWIFYFCMNSYLHNLSVYKILWISTILLYCLLLELLVLQNEKFRNDLLICLFVAAFITALVAYIELINKSTFFYSLWAGERYRNGIFRVGSTQGDPNTMSMYLVPLIFIFSTSKFRNLLGSTFVNICNLLLIILVFVSGSRTSLVALIISFGILLVYKNKKVERILFLLFCILVILMLPVIFDFFTSIDIASTGQRLKLVFDALGLWKNHLFTGIGFDQFYQSTQWMVMNEFVKQLTEFGIIGFTFYLLYWFQCYFRLFFVRKRIKIKTIKSHDNIYLASALTSWCINSCSMDSFYHYIAWIMPALVILFQVEEEV